MKSREERLDRYLEISALLPQAKAELVRYPGVTDVTVGLKETADRATDEIVFRVHVKEKIASADLPRAALIPKEILGVLTDVVLEPRPTNTDDDDKYRPLQGGIQIGNDSSSALGTLACIAQLNTDQSIVMLSNRHVMLEGRDAAVSSGEKIGQPAISCCCCCKGNIVGDVVNAAYNALVDCAIARITGSPGFTSEIQDIGLVFGSAPLNAAGSTVVVGDYVRKRGRTTGLTIGKVVNPLVATPANPAKGVPARTNQIQIRADAGMPVFTQPGDSGSAVVNDQNVVVGLHWGGDGTWSYSNLITNVVSAMNITIVNSGTPGTIPLAAVPGADVGAVEDTGAATLAEIQKVLVQSEQGRSIIELFDRHSREINDLLNTNRQVKVAWHRYQGPAFTAHVIKSAQEPGYRIPSAIADVSITNLLIRMSVELQQYGSPALASAVDRNTLPLLNLLDGATSVRELLERVGNEAPLEQV
jgi:hypothetical protein